MTKQEFIQKVANKSGLSARDAGKAVEAFMDSVTETLKARRLRQLHRFREVLAVGARGAPGRQSAHRRARPDRGDDRAEVLGRQPAEGCAQELARARREASGGRRKAALRPPSALLCQRDGRRRRRPLPTGWPPRSSASARQLVVGLDPQLDLMPVELRGDVARFCCGIVDAVAPHAVAVKPQLAFFEALGAAGMAAFDEVCAYARRAGLLVIADGKRGDIGSTARAYADAYLEGSPPRRTRSRSTRGSAASPSSRTSRRRAVTAPACS